MPESAHHDRLVKVIIAHIRSNFAHLWAFALVDDCSLTSGKEKPPRINGFVPDVYGIDAPHTITIIGEAKTSEDLITNRSRSQIAIFYEFLTHQDVGELVLAVPHTSISTARNMTRQLRHRLPSPCVNVTILTG